mgnify:CR=1 FL=1
MVILIGSGGVGFWAALAIERMGERVVVFDDDALEGTGALRLPDVRLFGRAFGKKVELLKFLARGVDVRAEKFSRAHADVVARGDILLDCSDLSSEQRAEFVEIARAREATYLRASYDLTPRAFVVVVARGLGFSRNPARGGYTLPPTIAHALVAGGFAADVVVRLLRGEDVRLPARLEIPYVEERI